MEYYDHVSVDDDNLHIWRCARGTNHTELVHQKMRKLFTGTTYISIEFAEAKLSEFRTEWNMRRHFDHANGSNIIHNDYELVYRLQALSARMYSDPGDCIFSDIIDPYQYADTEEQFGCQKLSNSRTYNECSVQDAVVYQSFELKESLRYYAKQSGAATLPPMPPSGKYEYERMNTLIAKHQTASNTELAVLYNTSETFDGRKNTPKLSYHFAAHRKSKDEYENRMFLMKEYESSLKELDTDSFQSGSSIARVIADALIEDIPNESMSFADKHAHALAREEQQNIAMSEHASTERQVDSDGEDVTDLTIAFVKAQHKRQDTADLEDGFSLDHKKSRVVRKSMRDLYWISRSEARAYLVGRYPSSVVKIIPCPPDGDCGIHCILQFIDDFDIDFKRIDSSMCSTRKSLYDRITRFNWKKITGVGHPHAIVVNTLLEMCDTASIRKVESKLKKYKEVGRWVSGNFIGTIAYTFGFNVIIHGKRFKEDFLFDSTWPTFHVVHTRANHFDYARIVDPLASDTSIQPSCESDGDPPLRCAGLAQQGNSCFLNVVLQVLLMLPSTRVRQLFTGGEHTASCFMMGNDTVKDRTCFLCMLCSLAGEHQTYSAKRGRKRIVLRPQLIYNNLKSLFSRDLDFIEGQQQCAAQLWDNMLDRMIREEAGCHGGPSLLRSLFQVHYVEKLSCLKSVNGTACVVRSSVVADTMMRLNKLDELSKESGPGQSVELVDLITREFSDRDVESRCGKCTGSSMNMSITLQHPSPFLMMKINRLTFYTRKEKSGTMSYIPISNRHKVDFPLELDMNSVMNISNDSGKCKYTLVACIVHIPSQSGDGGHYTVCVREKGDWREINDSIVSRNPLRATELAGKNPYMLMYKYVEDDSALTPANEPIVPVQSELSDPSLESATKVEKTALVQLPNVSGVPAIRIRMESIAHFSKTNVSESVSPVDVKTASNAKYSCRHCSKCARKKWNKSMARSEDVCEDSSKCKPNSKAVILLRKHQKEQRNLRRRENRAKPTHNIDNVSTIKKKLMTMVSEDAIELWLVDLILEKSVRLCDRCGLPPPKKGETRSSTCTGANSRKDQCVRPNQSRLKAVQTLRRLKSNATRRKKKNKKTSKEA